MNKKLTGLILGLALMFGAISTATAKVVNVWGSTGFVTPVNNFYDGLADHSSTIINGSLDSNNLAGVDLLWVIQPQTALTASENAHLVTFLAGGGRIAYMAEHCTFNPPMNANINASLTAVGSNILIACGTTQDPGFHIASKANNQILDHTLTAGVDTYEYAAFSPLSLGGSAETLMVGTDLTSIMMGFENLGAGSIFLITDQNVLNFDGTYDNDTMFQNLLIGVTGAPPPNSFTVGGTVSGLTGSVTLQNNGGDDIIKTTNDGFTFTAQAVDTDYAVTVSAQPTGQTCSVTNGSGTIVDAHVTNVVVDCVDDVVIEPTPAIPVPTLSQWALIILSMLLGLMVFANRRRLF